MKLLKTILIVCQMNPTKSLQRPRKKVSGLWFLITNHPQQKKAQKSWQKVELLVYEAGGAGAGWQVKFRAHIFQPNEQIPPPSPPLSFTPLSRFMKHDNNIRHSRHTAYTYTINYTWITHENAA